MARSVERVAQMSERSVTTDGAAVQIYISPQDLIAASRSAGELQDLIKRKADQAVLSLSVLVMDHFFPTYYRWEK